MDKLRLLSLTTIQEGMAQVQQLGQLGQGIHFGRYWLAKGEHVVPGREPLWLGQAEAARRFFYAGRHQFRLDYTFPPLYLAALPQAQLVGNGYVLVTGDNLLLTDSFSGDHILQHGGHFLKQNLKINLDGREHNLPFALYRDQGVSRVIREPALLLAHYWHFNYHHWVIDCLPRLRYALEDGELADCLVVVPGRMSPFQQDSLQQLGLDSRRLLPFQGQAWRFEQLYFPSIGVFSPFELGWLRNRLYRPQSTATRRLYISRGDAQTRRLLNEEALGPIFSRHGFEVITLTGRTFAEQLELFATASHIMGAHGAGLTNLLFAPAGATLIELAPNDQINHCFWLLANSGQHRYTFLTGPVANPKRDFTIIPDQLDQLLQKID